MCHEVAPNCPPNHVENRRFSWGFPQLFKAFSRAFRGFSRTFQGVFHRRFGGSEVALRLTVTAILQDGGQLMTDALGQIRCGGIDTIIEYYSCGIKGFFP